MRTVEFTIAVWGDAYVDTMLSAGLPSFLAPGNFPAVAEMAKLRLTVITRPEDVARISEHPAWRSVTDFGDARILPLLEERAFVDRNRYDVMAYCHRQAIRNCLRDKAILSVLSPDCIVAEGSLSFGLQRILNGSHAVLVAGPRAALDYVMPALAQYRSGGTGAALAIPSRDMASFVRRWPHPISSLLFWDAKPFSQFPSAVYWPVGVESIFARYFHLHPLFVDLANAEPAAIDSGTVDGSLISLAQIAPDRIYVAEHSQDVCVVELSRIDHDPMGSLPIEVADKTVHILEWAAKYADSSHRRQFTEHCFMFEGRESIDWAVELSRIALLTDALEEGLRNLDLSETGQFTPSRFVRIARWLRDGVVRRFVTLEAYLRRRRQRSVKSPR